jgi:hypothetical protein
MERSEVDANDVPVKLLHDELECQEIDEAGLERLRHRDADLGFKNGLRTES